MSCSASLSAFQPSSGKNPHELDKDEEELWQTTASLTAVEEISADAAVAALWSELGGIITLKEDQRRALKALTRRKDVFALPSL